MNHFKLLALLACVCLAISAQESDPIEINDDDDDVDSDEETEDDSEYTSSIIIEDQDAHVTGMYDAETQTCYLLRGGVPSSDSAPSELEAALDSETGHLAYHVTDDEEAANRSLLPAALQATCARLPLRWMETGPKPSDTDGDEASDAEESSDADENSETDERSEAAQTEVAGPAAASRASAQTTTKAPAKKKKIVKIVKDVVKIARCVFRVLTARRCRSAHVVKKVVTAVKVAKAA